MDRGDVQKLLDDLAALVGIDALELDEAGRAALRVDDLFAIDIEHDDANGVLLFSVDLASLGADPETGHLLEILRANFCFDRTAGATLALVGPQNLVVLQQAVRLEGLGGGTLVRVLESFTSTAEEWSKLTADMAEVEQAPAEPVQQTPPSGAMRV